MERSGGGLIIVLITWSRSGWIGGKGTDVRFKDIL
jgi:hypothetical protein